MQKNSSFLMRQNGTRAVKRYYAELGCVLVAENFFNREDRSFGEVYFIALKGRSMYFVEVKACRSQKPPSTQETQSEHNRAKIIKAAQRFLAMHSKYRIFMPKIHIVYVSLSPFDKTLQSIKIYTDVID